MSFRPKHLQAVNTYILCVSTFSRLLSVTSTTFNRRTVFFHAWWNTISSTMFFYRIFSRHHKELSICPLSFILTQSFTINDVTHCSHPFTDSSSSHLVEKHICEFRWIFYPWINGYQWVIWRHAQDGKTNKQTIKLFNICFFRWGLCSSQILVWNSWILNITNFINSHSITKCPFSVYLVPHLSPRHSDLVFTNLLFIITLWNIDSSVK